MLEILLGVIAFIIVAVFIVWLIGVVIVYRKIHKLKSFPLPDPFYSLETRTAPRNLHRAYA